MYSKPWPLKTNMPNVFFTTCLPASPRSGNYVLVSLVLCLLYHSPEHSHWLCILCLRISSHHVALDRVKLHLPFLFPLSQKKIKIANDHQQMFHVFFFLKWLLHCWCWEKILGCFTVETFYCFDAGRSRHRMHNRKHLAGCGIQQCIHPMNQAQNCVFSGPALWWKCALVRQAAQWESLGTGNSPTVLWTQHEIKIVSSCEARILPLTLFSTAWSQDQAFRASELRLP